MSLIFWLSLFFPLCLVIAMVTDFRRFEIPNLVCLALALSFLPVAYLADFSLPQIGWRLGIGALMFLVGLALFSMRLFGGGDGKLLAAASIWTGHEALPGFLFYVAIFGGLLAITVVLLRKTRLAETIPESSIWAKFLNRENGIPYGVAIGCAGLMIFPWLPGLS
jgi:prepilin peptidase CpaA